jgi:hypothetical protein
MMGIAKNRQVAISPGKHTAVKNLGIPPQGQVVHLKDFGRVKVFQKKFKNDIRGSIQNPCIVNPRRD